MGKVSAGTAADRWLHSIGKLR